MVYDDKRKKYIEADKQHCFRLRTKEGKYKKVTLKELYYNVYGLNWCIDNVEDLEREEWRVIEGTHNKYMISSCGRCKSLTGYEAIIMKPYITSKGYPRITIIQYGEKVSKFVHTLVGQAFLLGNDEIKVGYELHHIDKNPLNANVSNLVYLSEKEHREIHKQLRQQEKESRKNE